MTRKFLVEVEEGETTRWIIPHIETFFQSRIAYDVEHHTTGKIPRVTVKELNDSPELSNEEIRALHAAARSEYPEAKP
ncbi:MAG TPA: hypothetical protein VN516_03530, partial [Candidatus Baltobacteraceae bacterium]|nr:hypothetical protein [Candidatus Baltobacteraceae bacterium]